MFSDPRLWLDILQTLVIAMLWVRKTETAAIKQVDDIDHRVTVVEGRLQTMPSAADVAELKGSVRVTSTQIHGLEDSVRVTRATVARIEHYLLEAKK